MGILNPRGLFALALTVCTTVAFAAAAPRYSTQGLQTVYQFGNDSWLENMAVRSNGHILATDLDKGLIYDLDPNQKPVIPVTVATLPPRSVPLGITEVEPDVFYFNNGIGDALQFEFDAGSFAIWKLDMNPYNKGHNATTSKVIELPPAGLLNGIVTVSAEAGIILTSDSAGGTIYSVNVHKPSYSLALDQPLLKPDPNAQLHFGVNGIRIRGSNLYFCNTNYGYLGTFPISSSGVITPNPTLITSSVPDADDFDIDDSGNVWLAENIRNTLVRVTPAGQITVIAGGVNSTALLGPVSARFGRGQDHNTLYVSTDGLSFDAQGNPITTAGKIAKLDIASGVWSGWAN